MTGETWTASDGTIYAKDYFGTWLRLGYYRGMTTAHILEFANEFKKE